MAIFYATSMQEIADGDKIASRYLGKDYSFVDHIPLTGYEPDDRVICGRIPRGAFFKYISLIADPSINAGSFMSFGTLSDPDYFVASIQSVSIVAGSPLLLNDMVNTVVPMEHEEDIYMTILSGDDLANIGADKYLQVVTNYKTGQ